MVLPIVRYPEPVLRAKCRPVSPVTPEIRKLAEDMIDTMREANGVGLAAPQVAVDVQLAVKGRQDDGAGFVLLVR